MFKHSPCRSFIHLKHCIVSFKITKYITRLSKGCRYTSDHIFSYIELDEQHAIIEVAVPGDWQGRSIGELEIRRRYGVNILGVKRNGKTDVNVLPETVLDADMTLLVLGENQELKKHFRL